MSINKSESQLRKQQQIIDGLLEEARIDKENQLIEMILLEKEFRAKERKKKMAAHMQEQIDALTKILKEYNYE